MIPMILLAVNGYENAYCNDFQKLFWIWKFYYIQNKQIVSHHDAWSHVASYLPFLQKPYYNYHTCIGLPASK